MPQISPQTNARLLEFVSLINQGVSNPLDIPSVFSSLSTLRRAFEVLAADPLIDIIILHVSAEFFPRIWGTRMTEFTECILDVTRKNQGAKPIVLAVTNESKLATPEKYVKELVQGGILAYTSLSNACRALNRFASYCEFRLECSTQPDLQGQA